MSKPRRLLFFSQILAMPNHHGGCVYPHALLTELHRQGIAINYAWLGRPLTAGRRLMRDPLVAPFVTRGWVRGTRKIGPFLFPEKLNGWFSSTSDAAVAAESQEHIPTAGEKAFTSRLIRQLMPNVIVIDGTHNLPILDSLAPAERARVGVAVLTHNLQSRRTNLYHTHGQSLDFLPMTRDEETALLERADLVIAIQEREAEAFRVMLPRTPVVTIPMPIVPQPQPPEQAIAGRCLFVGGYSGHNIEAVHWLLRDIWPHVRAAIPSAQLAIVGTVCKAVKSPPEGIQLLGPSNDLRNAYAQASISLVPLPMGTGLKIKLVEAMGYGRAVITTSAGAEGFAELESGKIACLADNASSFIAEIVRLLKSNSSRQEVVRRQLTWVEQVLNPPVALRPLLEFWHAANPPTSHRIR